MAKPKIIEANTSIKHRSIEASKHRHEGRVIQTL